MRDGSGGRYRWTRSDRARACVDKRGGFTTVLSTGDQEHKSRASAKLFRGAATLLTWEFATIEYLRRLLMSSASVRHLQYSSYTCRCSCCWINANNKNKRGKGQRHGLAHLQLSLLGTRPHPAVSTESRTKHCCFCCCGLHIYSCCCLLFSLPS